MSDYLDTMEIVFIQLAGIISNIDESIQVVVMMEIFEE